MDKEVWKDVKGYEGYYQVAIMGVYEALTVLICEDSTEKGRYLLTA